MDKESLFKIIGITCIVIMTVVVILTFIELKRNPCGALTCHQLFDVISNRSCFSQVTPAFLPKSWYQ